MQEEPETASQNENDGSIIDMGRAIYPAGKPATIIIIIIIIITELAPAAAFRHLTRHC
jgi:hypothetical protein